MTLDILIPFYGRPDQFTMAIESVLAQSSPNWRLTVVDDRNPDLAPGQWVETMTDPRVTYLRNAENLGVSGNFRRCVDLMREEFAVIMGCDDVMLPDFVRRFEELTTQFPQAVMIQPGVRVINDMGVVSRPLPDRVKDLYRPAGTGPRLLSGEPLAMSLARGNWAYFPSLIWRVAVIQEVGFRDDLEVALDLALLLEISARGGNLLLDDRVVFEYRRHLGSVSSFTATDGSRFVEERSVLWDAADRFDSLGWRRASRVARRYFSSRLNALSVWPRAVRTATRRDRSILANHILGRAQVTP
jgi:glycosyltransferase involved in cell wall biosynthesis